MEWNINGLIHREYVKLASEEQVKHRLAAYEALPCAVMALYGIPGSGKTHDALTYCKRNTAALYFSFRGLTEELARTFFVRRYPRVFTGPCETWAAFFEQLRDYAKKKNPVIFFDDPGERNDKTSFYEALSLFNDQLMEDRTAMVVLLCEPWNTFPVPYYSMPVPPVTPPQLSRMLKDWSEEDLFRLYSLTGGILALVQEAAGTSSFREYLDKVCGSDSRSAFLLLCPCWLEKAFRAPEAYNTLLYGLALGHDRIMELAAFSGFPKNKCEKYLCALLGGGFVYKDKPEGQRPTYGLSLPYLDAWYRFVFPAMQNTSKLPERIAAYVENTLLPEMLHAEAVEWIENHAWDKMNASLHAAKPECENITIRGILFDYVEKTPDETVFVKAQMRFEDEDWPAIERAVESVVPFYNAKIALCSVRLFSRFYWKLYKQYGNIRLVQLKSLG